jgi:uncharacterized protein YkwD
MPRLEVPDQPEVGLAARTLEVNAPVVLGRDVGCEVQLGEKKASRRHAKIERTEDGAWVLEDLDSSNGTFVGGTRVLRGRLFDGVEVQIGDTRLVWRDPTPAAEAGAALVGGRLALRAVGGTVPPAPEPEPEEAVVEAGPVVRVRPLDMRSFGRGLALFLVGLSVFVVVGRLLGGKAERAREESAQRRAVSDLLSRADVDDGAFAALAADYLARHPLSPDRAVIERHLDSVRERAARRAGVEARFAQLLPRLGQLPEDVLRSELLELKRRLPEDAGLAERVRLAEEELQRRRAAFDAAQAERVPTELASLLDPAHPSWNPGEALRRATAWRAGRALPSAGLDAGVADVEQRAIEALKRVSAEALAAAKAESDPAKRRRVLMAVWPLVAGTFAAEPVADALRYAASPPKRQPGAGTPGTDPSDPQAAAEALLARAAAAEKLFVERRWVAARAAFEGLLHGTSLGLLAQEWRARVSDLDRVLGLVDALGHAAQSEKGVPVRLATGPANVRAATREGVTLTRGGGGPEEWRWEALAPEDLSPLLTPAKPSREQRLGLAVLASSLGDPEALQAALLPLYEGGVADAEVDGYVARLVEGRAQPPEGGYRLHKGRLLDPTAHAEALEAERLDGLAARGAELLARIAKEPALKKLERMRERRAELDRRRQHALLAIFNEKHYPYPYGRGQPPYVHVQAEVDRRVAAVRELWDGDESVKLPDQGSLAQACGEVGQLIAELDAKGRDTAELKARLAETAPYLTGQSIKLRDFWTSEAERRLMDYNRWVMGIHNPSQKGYAADSEVQQVAITNAYRMMLGFTVQVTPGDAAYEAIDATNVAKVLDQGRLVERSLTSLRALRIDDRLVKSSRLHSLDMQRRGYFDHFSPPDPATGAPRRSPFDRMRDAGYQGHGASENIAQAGSPQMAHDMWCRSSGHHRNILSAWVDMGTGQAGGALWTQNFGTGGGAAPVVPPSTVTPREPGQR